MALVAPMAWFGAAGAADLTGPGVTAQRCMQITHSPISDLPSQEAIKVELDNRYMHAVDVAGSERAYSSLQPIFTWANHAKAECGKAIGFLASGEVNVEMIDRCDCFYDRMVEFSN
jgi:hypothetical protein